MYSTMLVNCSNCREQLQLPPGAQSIRCTLCYAITPIADPHAVPPQPPSSVPPPPNRNVLSPYLYIYHSPMLVDCSECCTPLQLPPGAQSIRCALCKAVTHIADPRAVPPQQPSSVPPPPYRNARPPHLSTYHSPMLVNCSNCRTPLQLPPGAQSIRCTPCGAVTHIADPRAVPPQPPSSVHPSHNRNALSPYLYTYHHTTDRTDQSAMSHMKTCSAMDSPMLVNCSKSCTPLQLPPGAQSIGCARCDAVTRIADPRAVPPQPPSSVPPLTNRNAPSPYSGAPPGTPPNAHGQKKAVIVHILYRDSRHELKGCINNAKCMRDLLINKFKFPESSIRMLTDAEEETDPSRIPNKHNMRMAMSWLVQGCQPGDSLVFYYSGHGSQQRNYNGDEADGYDETLCPLDFETQGMIVDDEINAALVRPLPRGVKLHALIDASHSGTMLDLPYLCRMKYRCRMKRRGHYVWEDHRPRSGAWKGSNGGEVISFSACDDRQTCADKSAVSEITSTGAMTFFFIQAIERGHGATYGSILDYMRTAIKNVSKYGGSCGDNVVKNLVPKLLKFAVPVVANIVYMLLTGGGGDDVVKDLVSMLLSGAVDVVANLISMLCRCPRQEPQLAACEPFDVYAKPFSF